MMKKGKGAGGAKTNINGKKYENETELSKYYKVITLKEIKKKW